VVLDRAGACVRGPPDRTAPRSPGGGVSVVR
jgi:hypothetical protein